MPLPHLLAWRAFPRADGSQTFDNGFAEDLRVGVTKR